MSIETMTKLATVTVGAGGSATIDFTNIPQTYTDLQLVLSARSNQTDFEVTDVNVSFNGVTTNQSERNLRASSVTGVISQNRTDIILGNMPSSTNTASVFSNSSMYISNYSGSSYKAISVDGVVPSNTNSGYYWWLNMGANLWSSTQPITSITLRANNGNWNFAQHSTATLYGIRNMRRAAGNSIKATGGNISFDGTYVVHTFNSSGIFTPTAALTADYLVVAGGGGGGGNVDGSATSSGGGGAGGLRCTVTATGGGGSLESRISLIPFNNYAVTVGAGGAAGDYYAGQQYGGDGSNSAFYTITSVGGGGGGYVPGTGRNGGSGGGGYASNSGGTGTANQGFNGAAGGGGGAGEAGGTDSAREGGDGVTTLISGTSVTYAGGGGGGNGFAGGTGGGGAGGTSGNGVAGTVNTGGGGGGAYQGGSPGKLGGAGGSGIVIIRYKA